MANILTIFLILAVTLKVVDFSDVKWLDWAILALLAACAGLEIAQRIKRGRRKDG